MTLSWWNEVVGHPIGLVYKGLDCVISSLVAGHTLCEWPPNSGIPVRWCCYWRVKNDVVPGDGPGCEWTQCIIKLMWMIYFQGTAIIKLMWMIYFQGTAHDMPRFLVGLYYQTDLILNTHHSANGCLAHTMWIAIKQWYIAPVGCWRIIYFQWMGHNVPGHLVGLYYQTDVIQSDLATGCLAHKMWIAIKQWHIDTVGWWRMANFQGMGHNIPGWPPCWYFQMGVIMGPSKTGCFGHT